MKDFKDFNSNDKLIGIISIIEGEQRKSIKKIWECFEKKFDTSEAQSFPHPHMTFQGGVVKNLNRLINDLEIFSKNLKPFKINVKGVGEFGKRVLFLDVVKTGRLNQINKDINNILKQNCSQLVDNYIPENWNPHITIALDDLTGINYQKGLDLLNKLNLNFSQISHNLTLIKNVPHKNPKIIKKFQL